MRLRKLLIVLLALLVVFSLAGCGGSGGGGDDDNGGSNGDNGGTNGGNGDNGGNGGGNEEPLAVTWTVSYQCDEGGGFFAFVDFKEDGTYCFGESNDVNNHEHDSGSIGTYTGDPRNDGVIYVTGSWDTGDVNNHPVTISSGAFDFGPFSMVRQGETPPSAVTWPVCFKCDMSAVYGVAGAFIYIDFRRDGTYIDGDGLEPEKYPPDPGHSGTYTGNPHEDGSIRVTGKWAGGDEEDYLVTISSGTFDFGVYSMVRQ